MPFRKPKPWGQTKPPVGSMVDWGDPISNGLVGCWLMNEGAGGTVYDAARKNNGAFVNSPTITHGIFGTALNFASASSQYVSFGNVLDQTGGTPFSISFWSRPIISAVSQIWVGKASTTGNLPGWFIATSTLNLGAVRFNGRAVNTTDMLDCYSTATPWLSASTLWSNIVVTYDGSRSTSGVRFYINQAVSATISNTNNNVTSWTNSALFEMSGRNASTPFLDGQMNNMRFYSRVLFASEVTRLYTEPFAGIATPRRRIISQVAAAGFTTVNRRSTGPRVGSRSYY